MTGEGEERVVWDDRGEGEERAVWEEVTKVMIA